MAFAQRDQRTKKLTGKPTRRFEKNANQIEETEQ
jgi:hypothetical protein